MKREIREVTRLMLQIELPEENEEGEQMSHRFWIHWVQNL